MARIETRSALARIAGVSPAAITKACKNSLKAGCVGKRVDLHHPCIVAYLTRKGVDPTSYSDPLPAAPSAPTQPRPRGPKGPRRKRAPGPSPDVEEGPQPTVSADVSTEEVNGFAHLTLEELIKKFGTATAFKDWLIARKRMADVVEKELRNHETRGHLIDRDEVRTHVFGAIEASNRRLLSDSPKTVARRLYALAKSGAPVEEAEKVVREIISSQLQPMQATVERVVHDA